MTIEPEVFYTIREAAEITGSSVPRFYTNKDKFERFKKDPNRVRSDYAIPRSYLIEIGWLNPNIKREAAPTVASLEAEIERLANEVSELKSKLEEANIRLAIRQEDVERLEAKLFSAK